MGDDCIGLSASRKLRDELEEVDVIEWPFSPISLINIVAEYDEVFIIDSFESDKAGEVRILNPSENYSISTHYSGVPTLIRVVSSLGVKFHVIGIGVRNVSMGEECQKS